MKTKDVTRVLFILYLLGLVWLVLFKLSFSLGEIHRYRAINLDPFHDALNHPIRTREVIDNFLIFIPFGILLSALDYKKNFFLKILPIFALSLIFEVLQYVFSLGSTDINDLITNTIGGFVGIIIFSVLKKVFKRSAEKLVNTLAIMFLVLVLILMGILYYFNR